MLLALGANKMGSRFGPVPRARVFYWAYLFLGLSEWACVPILKPYQLPPSALGYGERVQGLYCFLNRVRLPHVCSRLAWLGLCHRHMSGDNDDFSVFTPTSSTSFNFF